MRAIEQMEQQNAQAEVKEVKIETRKRWTHKKSYITVVEKENGKYILSLGRCIISEKEFETKTDAIKYIEAKPWELIRAYTVIMAINIFDVKMKVEKDVEKLAEVMNDVNEEAQNQKKE